MAATKISNQSRRNEAVGRFSTEFIVACNASPTIYATNEQSTLPSDISITQDVILVHTCISLQHLSFVKKNRD